MTKYINWQHNGIIQEVVKGLKTKLDTKNAGFCGQSCTHVVVISQLSSKTETNHRKNYSPLLIFTTIPSYKI